MRGSAFLVSILGVASLCRGIFRGWGDVSFHGSSQIPTPNLDVLAADGIILNNYYVAPFCTPSRASLLTGLYPIRTGMQGAPIEIAQPWGMSTDVRILPQYLKEFGYETHLVGKWHLGSYKESLTPTCRGFDSFYGFYNGEEGYYSHTLNYGNHTGLDFWFNKEPMWSDSGNYSTSLYTKRAQTIIKNVTNTKPLFLVVAYQATHSAVGAQLQEAPQEHTDKFSYIGNEERTIYAGGDATKMVGLDGHDMWRSLSFGLPSPRTEVLYNYDSSFTGFAALRDLRYKLVLNGTGMFDDRANIPGRRRPYHDLDDLLSKSTIAGVLRGLYKKEKLDLPRSWRRKARLTCGTHKTANFSVSASVYLFDIVDDPCELNNLASTLPDVVASLKKRLDAFGAAAAPVRNHLTIDPASFPENHGGTWAPWVPSECPTSSR
ncbi:hypothetical protein HPB50_015775 [Hyalomma asiaticum]|uniref:Uncharacterized protein n=1 Tax=Hyalomma asiaticum TaxID=266040 RepID=A0ACB7SVZ1_HYAAI|nr:hypothetical protein HPB50_015775 [Hyalomma asiaticum]